MKFKKKAKLLDNLSGWGLLLPVLVCLIIVKWHPIISGIVRSFYATRGYETTEFVGLKNYINVITDTLFVKTFFNTIKYVLWSLIIGFVPPLLLGVLLNEVRHFKRGFRVLTYLAGLVPSVAVTLIWGYIYNPGETGFLNMLLSFAGIPPQGWLQNATLSIPLMIVMMTWSGTPSSAIIYLAALKGVPNELYEAAIIDGSGIWKRFWNVTFPSIAGTALLLVTRQVINVFQIMEQPLMLTGGGPDNATMSLNLTSYNYAFTYMQVSRSLALSTCTFLFLIILTVLYFKMEKKIKE